MADALESAPCALVGMSDEGVRMWFSLASPADLSAALLERRHVGGGRIVHGSDSQNRWHAGSVGDPRLAAAWVPESLRHVAHPYGGDDGRTSLRAGSVWQFNMATENTGAEPTTLVNGANPVTVVGRPAVAAAAPPAPAPSAPVQTAAVWPLSIRQPPPVAR